MKAIFFNIRTIFFTVILAALFGVSISAYSQTLPSRTGSGNFWLEESDVSLNGEKINLLKEFSAGMYRVVVLESLYWGQSNNSAMIPGTLDDLLVITNEENLSSPLLQFRLRSGYPTSYDDWYKIGSDYARKFSPNSDWLRSQGIENWGVTYWGVGNEMGKKKNDPDDDDISPEGYFEVMHGFADGVKSVNPDALILAHGMRSTYVEIDWLRAVSSLFNDGTLDILDIHKYINMDQIEDGNWLMQDRFDEMKRRAEITADIKLSVTEFNTKEDEFDSLDDAARAYLLALWDTWAVAGNNNQPVTEFSMTWSLFNNTSSDPKYGMINSDGSLTDRGKVNQLVNQLTEDMTLTSVDADKSITYLDGRGKNLVVWNNWTHWTDTPSNYFLLNLPSYTEKVEVWTYDGFRNGPVRTIEISGNNAQEYLIENLNTQETYMFMIHAKPRVFVSDELKTVTSYGGSRDNGTTETVASRTSLVLKGNSWKDATINYEITPNTILEFRYKTSREGGIHAIGFDNNESYAKDADEDFFFQLYGFSTASMQQDFNNDYRSNNEWRNYRIPVGQYFTGTFSKLVFVNNHEVDNPTIGDSTFSDLKLYEAETRVFISDNLRSVTSYGGERDQGSVRTVDSRAALLLTGNTWKDAAINYEITRNTVLEFRYRTSREGGIHAIGFDNNESYGKDADESFFFQLYGFSTSSMRQNFNDYDTNNENKVYRIPVGQFFTGSFNKLVFVNNHEVDNPIIGDSTFGDIMLYEDRN